MATQNAVDNVIAKFVAGNRVPRDVDSLRTHVKNHMHALTTSMHAHIRKGNLVVPGFEDLKSMPRTDRLDVIERLLQDFAQA